MEINYTKLACYSHNVGRPLLAASDTFFPFPKLDPSEGLKYLGYYIKPNKYQKIDWHWLINKAEEKIQLWCNKWLSRGGRLILIKVVLEAIPVYWALLAEIPKSIMNKVKILYCNFLWKGCGQDKGIHLVKWTNLTFPNG